MNLTLSDGASIATIVGAFLAIIAIAYTAYQIRQNTLVAQGQFWLDIEKMFSAHDEVHLNLRPGGKWSNNNNGPENPADWAKIEDYMGLFEHCEIMLGKNLIDQETFASIFSYRINNIVSNEIIVNAKLINEKKSWKKFLNLMNRLNIEK